MDKTYALSTVIPVFNSADTIGDLVKQLANLSIEGGHEIILVNDGSKDNSREICENLIETISIPVTLVNLSRNFSEHNDVMAGFRYARGEYVGRIYLTANKRPQSIIRNVVKRRGT